MLNDPKCRTRAISSGRSHWGRLFIPDPNIGTSGSDAYKGHGYSDERFHVPSVSNHFLSCVQFDRNESRFQLAGLRGRTCPR
jgi:hypothetical protein